MTRNVRDTAALLTALAGPDPNDIVDNYHTSPNFTLDYTQYLDVNALRGKRLGVVGGAANMNNTPEGRRAREILQSLGATIIETGVSVSGSVSTPVLNYEFKRDLNKYLEAMTDPRLPVRSLLDIIDYYHNNPDTVPEYGFNVLIDSQLVDLVATRATYETNRNNSIMNARNSIDNALRTHNLDALISFASISSPGAASGYPSINVPIAYDERAALPGPNTNSWNPLFSLCFTGTAFSEANLIAMAYAFEQASMLRKPPGMALREGLRSLISYAEAMDESEKALILSVLDEAKAVNNSNFATQMDMDLAQDKLAAAIKAVQPVPITSLRIDVNVTVTVSRGDVLNFGLLLNEGAVGDNVVWSVTDPSFALVDGADIYILNKTGLIRLIATDPVSGLSHSIQLRIAS